MADHLAPAIPPGARAAPTPPPPPLRAPNTETLFRVGAERPPQASDPLSSLARPTTRPPGARTRRLSFPEVIIAPAKPSPAIARHTASGVAFVYLLLLTLLLGAFLAWKAGLFASSQDIGALAVISATSLGLKGEAWQNRRGEPRHRRLGAGRVYRRHLRGPRRA